MQIVAPGFNNKTRYTSYASSGSHDCLFVGKNKPSLGMLKPSEVTIDPHDTHMGVQETWKLEYMMMVLKSKAVK